MATVIRKPPLIRIYSGDHGSMLTKTEWGEVSGSTDGTFTDTGTDDRETTYEYATSSDLVLPSKITVEDDSSTKVQESRYYYDNQSLGSVTTGNLTKQQDWVIGSTYVDTELTYDSYGNILTKTDPNSNVTLLLTTHTIYSLLQLLMLKDTTLSMSMIIVLVR